MLIYLYIFIGGGLGAVSRFGMGKFAHKFLGDGFPYGTVLSNVFSCILLGIVIYTASGAKWLTDELKMFLIVGFCGGFSTFSAFSLDTVNLIKDNHILMAVINILISVILCVVILYLMVQKQKTV